jgi:virulence-associated protein VapD
MSTRSYQLLAIAKSLYNSFKDDQDALDFAIGLIAEGIHRLKPRHTGLISVEANQPGVKICKEHFFGRLSSAKKLIQKIAEGKWSDTRLVQFINSRSRVHYTTSRENQELRKYAHLHWREAYRRVDIQLVKFVPRRTQKCVYRINGIDYNITDAAKKYNCTKAVVIYRCYAKSIKWIKWQRININEQGIRQNSGGRTQKSTSTVV